MNNADDVLAQAKIMREQLEKVVLSGRAVPDQTFKIAYLDTLTMIAYQLARIADAQGGKT